LRAESGLASLRRMVRSNSFCGCSICWPSAAIPGTSNCLCSLLFIQRFADSELSLAGIYEEAIPGCDWIHPVTEEFVSGPEPPRIEDLDEIPSPYLNGWLKDYYPTGYFPMMQINCGCPFSCTFCNSAPASNSKIFGQSLANVQADLLHLARCNL
jgi:hypothetical protein